MTISDIEFGDSRIRVDYPLQRTSQMQYIMSHADIIVTLDTHIHVKFDDAKEKLLRVATS